MATRIEVPLSFLAHIVGAAIVVASVIILVVFGQSIEAEVSPVVSFAKADGFYRNAKIGCFTLHLTKEHAAIPLKYAFTVEAKLSEGIPVSAYVADGHHFKSQSDLITHPVGQSWSRDYCFEMPSTIADDQDMRVSGRAEHWRFPWLNVRGGKPVWRSVTPVPAFNICALDAPQDGVCQRANTP